MKIFEWMHRAVDALRDLPGIYQLRRAVFEHRFAHYDDAQLFRGVFPSFAAATASAPSNRPIGCDNEASANLSVRLSVDLKPYDYPALFWLADAFHRGLRTVADLGGSVGMKYFAFARVTDYPEGLQWRVIEVAAMVKRGRAFAHEHGAPPALAFSDRIADADGCDVLYASGALQYLERSLGEIVAGFAQKPKRLIVNTTPIHAQRSFFTLNSIGTAYCAYRVDSRRDFLAAVEAQGYVLRGEWQHPGKPLDLAFEAGYSLDHYSGFCFDLSPGSAGS